MGQDTTTIHQSGYRYDAVAQMAQLGPSAEFDSKYGGSISNSMWVSATSPLSSFDRMVDWSWHSMTQWAKGTPYAPAACEDLHVAVQSKPLELPLRALLADKMGTNKVLKAVDICWAVSAQCNRHSAREIRFHCPRTCGCDDIHSGLFFQSHERGCPVSCHNIETINARLSNAKTSPPPFS